MTESRFDQSTYFLKIFLKTKGPPTTVAKLCFWLNLWHYGKVLVHTVKSHKDVLPIEGKTLLPFVLIFLYQKSLPLKRY